jgi:hypothetical protein
MIVRILVRLEFEGSLVSAISERRPHATLAPRSVSGLMDGRNQYPEEPASCQSATDDRG